MKFNEIAAESWSEWQPFMDTCLLPVTGLKGDEDPLQVTKALEALKDVMDRVEIPFKGRIVTYPAIHFFHPENDDPTYINRICQKIKEAGFKFVVIATAVPAIAAGCWQADAVISPVELDGHEGKEGIANKIAAMWERRM